MFWKSWRMPEFLPFQLHLKFNMGTVHIINTKNKFTMIANYNIYIAKLRIILYWLSKDISPK